MAEGTPGKTRCLHDVEALAFVEGTCPPAERTTIVEHLTMCGVCRELVSGLFQTENSGAPSAGPSASPGELIGPYRFGELIAEGGMGRIYRAVDTKLKRDVAIKVPRVLDLGLMRRFEREVAITARLQHPGIVPIHGAGVMPDGTPFYVMRFIEGTALDALFNRTRDLPGRLELVKHLVSVGETMAYVHGEEVVHRDLKPNNVLVGKFGETLIIDWGIAKDLGDRRSEAETAQGFGRPSDPNIRESDPVIVTDTTRLGDVLGTPGFMAPEQAAGLRVDLSADVYALGAILRYLLIGKIDLPGSSSGHRFEGIPRALVAVHDRATASERSERYPDARAFTDGLRAALAEAMPAPVVRRRLRWLAPLIGLGIAAGVGVKLLWSSSTASPPPAGLATIEPIADEPPGTRSVAISPSGTRVGFGGLDRLEIRDLETKETWSRPGWIQWPGTVMFETDDVVIYSAVDQTTGRSYQVRWDLRTKQATQAPNANEGYGWFGTVEAGEIVVPTPGTPRLVIVRDGVSREVATSGFRAIEQVAIAPDRKRFALADSGSLRIVEADGTTYASPPLTDLASLTWFDDTTLLYATGLHEGSTLYKVTATPEGLARPTKVYEARQSSTWIGALAAARGRIVMSVVGSVYESHLFGTRGNTDERLDPVSAAAPLGWRGDASWLAWNRSTQAIEIRQLGSGALPTMTPVIVHGDPANTTRADDVLIVSLRDAGGRRVEAVSLIDGKQTWSRPRDELVFVRCANDATAPCVAGVVAANGRIELRRIDPTTGVVSELVVDGADIVDAAIDATGTSLVWITNYTVVHLRPLADAGAGVELAQLAGSHSVAFTRDGGVLASTFDGTVRNIVRLQGERRDVIVRAGSTIVSMVRPSPNGEHLLFRARTLTFKLVELHLGAP